MRNLLVLAAAFGLAGVANAQNSSAIDQTGTNNSATATQSGGASLVVDQGLHGNIVGATQAGASSATITQASTGLPGSTGGHEAQISQIGGDGNLIQLSQSFGTNALGPKGAHDATINQDGSNNTVAGAFDGTSYDDAVQDSRTNLTATINQTGSDNRVNFHDGTNLTIDQDGVNNYAQTRGGGTVDIDQLGNNNQAFNGGQSATIFQDGDWNLARTTSNVSGTTTSQIQRGDYNESQLLMTRGGGSAGSTTQDGDYNSIVADYDGTRGNSVTSTQDAGEFGVAGASNFATVNFSEDGNTVIIDQTLTGAGMNQATLNMNSVGGSADVMQNGVGNSTTVTQN